MTTPLTDAQLAELRKIDTPTMSNIIEMFDTRPRNQGFMLPQIRCQTPAVGVVAGYACTVTVRCSVAGAGNPRDSVLAYLEWSQQAPRPRITVAHDIDREPFGAMLGEVFANIHRACGFVGFVSNGYYRDVEAVAETGLAVFCAGACVSHGYVHIVDHGEPVEIGGLIVHPGDLLHGDRHGVVKVPREIAPDVAGRLTDIEKLEGPIISLCKSRDFSLARLRELFGRPM